MEKPAAKSSEGAQSGRNPYRLRSRSEVEDAKEWTPKALAQWVNDLPLINAGETAKLIYLKLNEANHYHLPWRTRLDFLVALREPLNLVLTTLERKYTGMRLPLHGKAAKLPELAQRLATRMIVGYKNIMMEKPSGFFTQRRALRAAQTQAAHDALFCLLQIILTCYRLYQSAPPYLWKEIHHTFAYARERDFHRRAIASPIGDTEPPLTIEDRYKQILLLELAAPNRLQQHEIQLVCVAAESWAHLTSLILLDDVDSDAGVFIIEPSIDAPPRHFDSGSDMHLKQVWVLHTEALAAKLTEYLADKQSTPQTGAIRDRADTRMTPDLAKTLSLHWAISALRSDPRTTEKDAYAKVLYGMRSVFQLLQVLNKSQQVIEDDDLGEADLNGDSSRIQVMTPEGQILVRDARGIIPVEPSTLVLDDIEPSSGPDGVEVTWDDSRWAQNNTDEPEEVIPVNCVLFDHSKHGVQLGCRRAYATQVRVGSILAVTTKLKGLRHWRVGLIRWLRIENDNTRFGVELLPTRPRPVLLKRYRRGSYETDDFPALLVSINKEEHTADVLLQPTFISPNDRLELFDRDQQWRVTRVLNDQGSASVTRLSLELRDFDDDEPEEPQEEPKTEKSDELKIQGADDELEDIWQTL